jgi:riboflavin kinase/FMN adenylyltransferase
MQAAEGSEHAPRGAALVIEHADGLTPRPRRVAIGTFDGVHAGHAEIVRGCDTVLTFDPHPLAVLAPERAPKLLTALSAKAELLARLGVRELVTVRFDELRARQSARDFVEEIVLGRLGAVHVSVGSNFRYGARGAGDPASLLARPELTTAVAELVCVDGAVVSSSRIRAAVAAGEVEQAARMLGRPHRVPCRVLDGATGRIAFDDAHACPPPGRYRCILRAPGASGARTFADVDVAGAEGHVIGGPRLAPHGHLTVELLTRRGVASATRCLTSR